MKLVRRVDPPVHMPTCAVVNNDDPLPCRFAGEHRGAPEIQPGSQLEASKNLGL